MSTAWQLVIVALLIVAATAYVARSIWNSWTGKSEKGCASGCGKCAAPPETKSDGRFPLPQA
jgi:hypothetical protein